MNPRAALQRSPQGAQLILAGFVTLLALYEAQAVIVPIVAAIIAGMMVGPLVDRARRHGIHAIFVSIAITAGLFVAAALAVVLMSEPISVWIARIPETGARLTERLGFLTRPLSAWRQIEGALRGASSTGAPSVEVAMSPASVLTYVVGLATPALGQFVVFITAFFFFVASRQTIKQRVTLSFMERENRLAVLHTVSEIESNLATWISTMCLINLSLAALMALALYLLGVPNAVMWGGFVFALNFVPYVGPLLMAILLVAVGFLTFETTGQALLPAAIFFGMVTLEGNFITPHILGRRLNISPFVVFIAIVFWSWMWGPAGALLAMPLLIAMQVILLQMFPPEAPELPG